MCEFCTEHGEGRKWYLEMKNYAEDLLHEKLPPREQKLADAPSRAQYLRRFRDSFLVPAAGGPAKTFLEMVQALAPEPELRVPRPPDDEVLAGWKAVHFGQVVPLEDA